MRVLLLLLDDMIMSKRFMDLSLLDLFVLRPFATFHWIIRYPVFFAPFRPLSLAYWKRTDGLMGRTRTQGMGLTCLLESCPESRFNSDERQVRVSLVSGNVKLP